ncbi:hypothetical protein [Aeromonas veronii]|uniref:hypothetical protein n=1 Tax=Aeromonas veronii TaxID=654 RepID=UPI003BA23C15
MQNKDNNIMVIFEALTTASRQHESDTVLLHQTLLAASTIVEGIEGPAARQLERMIDACVLATQRTLNTLAVSNGELHEIKMDIGHHLRTHQALLKDKQYDHRQ